MPGEIEEVEGSPEGGLGRLKAFVWEAGVNTWRRLRGNASGAFVQGPAANDAAAVGNPVQAGGVANSDPPTSVGNGDVLPLREDLEGRLIVQRETIERTPLASAARTTSSQSANQTNRGWNYLLAFVDITAASGTTPTLDIRLDAASPAASTTFRRLAGSDGTAVAFPQMTVSGDDDHLHAGPTLIQKVTGTDRHFNIVLARLWRWDFTIGGTTPSFTFSLAEVLTG